MRRRRYILDPHFFNLIIRAGGDLCTKFKLTNMLNDVELQILLLSYKFLMLWLGHSLVLVSSYSTVYLQPAGMIITTNQLAFQQYHSALCRTIWLFAMKNTMTNAGNDVPPPLYLLTCVRVCYEYIS